VANLESHNAGGPLLEVGVGIPVVFYVIQQFHVLESAHPRADMTHRGDDGGVEKPMNWQNWLDVAASQKFT